MLSQCGSAVVAASVTTWGYAAQDMTPQAALFVVVLCLLPALDG
jgi:hypothetical protein